MDRVPGFEPGCREFESLRARQFLENIDMLKRYFKNWLPDKDSLKKEKNLRWLGTFLDDPNLWHINKRSTAGGVAAGLLVAFIPLPIQMLLAVLLALTFRVNVLIAVATTWLSNPLTFFPLVILITKIGNTILGNGNTSFSNIQEFNIDWQNISSFGHSFYAWCLSLGKAFLIGLPVLSITSAILGYIIIRLIWKITVTIHYFRRKNRTKSKSSGNKKTNFDA